jgi:cytochrome c oxidase accessory protein FixG
MQEQENFRDSIGTIREDGKRKWIFPKKPSGRYYSRRKLVSYFLLIFLLASPFVKINGNQFIMINVLERRFNIFGFPFWPQDFHLFVISMIIGVVFIALFTVSFGRIFCGWICPQTIFMEMVFRRIEFLIEGNQYKQKRLKEQPWNAEKIFKRLLKWFVFAVISFVISNVFLAYLISGDLLLEHIREGIGENSGTFIALSIFTAVFYWVFSWFREQVCIIACPYGRLQGVLLDNKSIIVAYDHVRGEGTKGRKKFKKGEDREANGHGDCIDCDQCVQVCPTGIDIRNGTQLECINCTACIDECDTVMDKIDKPRGLIRYASEDNIAKNKAFDFNLRMKGYTGVLIALIAVLISMLFLRNSVEASILRLPGQLFEHKDTRLSNVFTYKIINKTDKEIENVQFKVLSIKGTVKVVSGDSFSIEPTNYAEGTLFIEIESALINKAKTELKIGVYSNDELIDTTEVNFLGPRSFH